MARFSSDRRARAYSPASSVIAFIIADDLAGAVAGRYNLVVVTVISDLTAAAAMRPNILDVRAS